MTTGAGRRIAGWIRPSHPRPPGLVAGAAITIRLAWREDESAATRLAELSGRPRPQGPLLLAEVDGEVWAALPLAGGDALADPFRPTAELRALLALRAAQLRRLQPEPGREEHAQVVRLSRRHRLTAGPPPGPRLS